MCVHRRALRELSVPGRPGQQRVEPALRRRRGVGAVKVIPGVIIGGLPNVILEEVTNAKMAASVVNLVGTIRDFAFIDDLSVRIVAMNEPVSFFNSAIGRDRVIM